MNPEEIGLKEAEIRSKGCEYCSGSGMATAYRPDFTGNRVITIPDERMGERRIPSMVAAHCVCELGRWIRGKTDARMLDRIPDFTSIVCGYSSWLADDPRRISEKLPPFNPRRRRDVVVNVGEGRG